jgi:hypothetical protein
MSGGSDTVTQQNFPDWAVPYAQNYLQRSQQVADMPYQAYGGQTVAGLNPYQTAGYNAMAQRAMQGSPVSDAASSELTRTLSGGYLNNNPYLDQLVDQSSRDVMRNMDVLQARSGSFGNSGVYQNTAQELGDVSARIRGTDYANERQRMVSSIGLAPTIANQDYTDAQQLLAAGQGFRGFEQQNLDDQYRRFQEAQNYPQQQLATLGRGLGLNYGSSSTVPGQNPWGQAIGTGLAAYGAYNGGGGSK